jgi:hypothetical protein
MWGCSAAGQWTCSRRRGADKSYATLLRRWAQGIDALVEAPCDRAVLEMFRSAPLLGEGDDRDE